MNLIRTGTVLDSGRHLDNLRISGKGNGSFSKGTENIWQHRKRVSSILLWARSPPLVAMLSNSKEPPAIGAANQVRIGYIEIVRAVSHPEQ